MAFAVVMVILAGTYLYGSSAVYDAISIVQPHCGGHFGSNTPASFTVDGLDASPYLMPEYEDVTLPSRDPDIDISGWYIPSDAGPAGPAVVLVHGHGSCKREDRMLLAAGMLHRAGIGALMIDLRNMGESTVVDGRYAGGTREYRDALGGWDWLVDEQGYAPDRVGIYGQSLGAATSLIATGEEPCVAAVWADSSYADFDEAVQAEMARHDEPTIFRFGGYLMARIRSGDDLLGLSPTKAVAKLDGRPIFITQGAADTRLSPTYAGELADAVRAAGGQVDDPWMVPGAEHTQGIVLEPAEYERRLDRFFGAALQGA